MDKTNRAILSLLKADARLSWQEIGKRVHLTGQAVASRVEKMQDQGLISGYTLRQNNAKRHFITVFMHSPAFSEFEAFLAATEEVEAAYKTTGEGCYLVIWLESETHTLEAFLNALLRYGKYKVASAIRGVK